MQEDRALSETARLVPDKNSGIQFLHIPDIQEQEDELYRSYGILNDSLIYLLGCITV